MADFVQTAVSKSALRVLRYPIPNMTAFETVIAGVISGNPWGCIPYTRAGVSMPPVERTSETYTGKVLYQDSLGKIIGDVTIRAKTQAGLTSAISDVVANTAIEGFIGGDAIHDPITDKYSCALRCCDSSGDMYTVTFTRDRVRITSYVEDSLLATLETWADGVAVLE